MCSSTARCTTADDGEGQRGVHWTVAKGTLGQNHYEKPSLSTPKASPIACCTLPLGRGRLLSHLPPLDQSRKGTAGMSGVIPSETNISCGGCDVALWSNGQCTMQIQHCFYSVGRIQQLVAASRARWFQCQLHPCNPDLQAMVGLLPRQQLSRLIVRPQDMLQCKR